MHLVLADQMLSAWQIVAGGIAILLGLVGFGVAIALCVIATAIWDGIIDPPWKKK